MFTYIIVAMEGQESNELLSDLLLSLVITVLPLM